MRLHCAGRCALTLIALAGFAPMALVHAGPEAAPTPALAAAPPTPALPTPAVPAPLLPTPVLPPLSALVAAPVTAADGAIEPALVRVTSSFESGHAAAVLRQVAKLFSAGFVRKDADQVAKQIGALPADQSQRWEFQGIYKGAPWALQVRARLDDFGTLDLDFFTAPAMAARIRSAVDNYLNSRGL